MRRFTLILALGVVITALAGCAKLSTAGAGSTTPSTSAEPSGSNPPPPESAQPRTLQTQVVDSVGNLTYDPPSVGSAPAVSASEALDTAWTQEGAPGSPSSVHLTYALLKWGQYDDAPVWVVTYEGTCVPAHGGLGSQPSCLSTVFNTLIDGSTGEYIASYTDTSEAL